MVLRLMNVAAVFNKQRLLGSKIAVFDKETSARGKSDVQELYNKQKCTDRAIRCTKNLGHPCDAISQGLKKSKRNKRNNYKRLTTVSVHNIVALYNVP